MNSRKVQLILVALTAAGLSVGAIDIPAQAQSPSPAYYAAQLAGGSLAALAGGLGGTLVGGLSGALLGVAFEFLEAPFAIYQETDRLSRAVDWAFLGAKAGFGLGASLGAAAGVVYIASASGVAGDPQGAMIGAFIGGMVGMTILLDASRPFFQWRFIQTSEGLRARAKGGVEFKLLLNPVTLAALGATIGYNMGAERSNANQAISMPLVALRF